jgi:hypothetical protein
MKNFIWSDPVHQVPVHQVPVHQVGRFAWKHRGEDGEYTGKYVLANGL